MVSASATSVDRIARDALSFSLSDASRPAYGIDPAFAGREARLREGRDDYPYRLVSMRVSVDDGIWTLDTKEYGKVELSLCHSSEGKLMGMVRL